MIYFTSDLHFGHKNIIRFDNRPFTSVEEMDKVLIERWNNKVTDEDTVYILGDISWYDDQKTYEIFSQLRGRKILIQGNHDKVNGKTKECFEEICFYKEINLPGGSVHIILCHYPIMFFNNHNYGTFMLYGHVHNSTDWDMVEKFKSELHQLGQRCYMFNVGCMVRNYEPVTLDEILQQEERKDQNASKRKGL